MAFEPVHHVAAIRSAGGRHSCFVDERVILYRVIETVHQILENPAPPVPGNLIRELLPVTCAATRIYGDYNIPWCGKHIGIPAVVEDIAPGSLRSAVHQEHQRVFLGGVETGRPDYEALNFGPSRTPEGESLGITQIELCQKFVIGMGQLPYFSSIAVEQDQFRGHCI